MKLAPSITCALSVINAVSCMAEPETGKTKVQWLAISNSYQAGQPLQTAISMRLEEGLHTYWENPGEAGMKMKVLWELPAGWKTGELEYPSPSRFTTSGLTSYGYKGTVVFPVLLYPPAETTGPVELKAKLSWLVCNDNSCLPGSAEITLDLTSGLFTQSDAAEMIEESLKKIPRDATGDISLTVSEGQKELRLALATKDMVNFNPLDYEAFPATPQVIDEAAKYEWIANEEPRRWQVTLPKSEYAVEAVNQLELVFVGKGGQAPLRVSWKKR